jgi:hypothetical protein
MVSYIAINSSFSFINAFFVLDLHVCIQKDVYTISTRCNHSNRHPRVYYACGIENLRRHPHQTYEAIGLIVVLISIEIARFLTVHPFRDTGGPGVPVPAVTVSLYTVVIYVIISKWTNNFITLPFCKLQLLTNYRTLLAEIVFSS